MVTIYCIEDCNSLKYVGSTKLKLNKRLTNHKHDKKIQRYFSSSKLDLDNCIIYSLETCNKSERSERERYWINKIECVNDLKLNYNHNEHSKKYYHENKEKVKEYQKEINLFKRKSVVNGCYEFIKMLEEY